MERPAGFDKKVFLNCPFDAQYEQLFRGMIFTIIQCGFVPCSALARSDGGEIRLHKITQLIAGCRLAIHDISRTGLETGSRLPRFNMPFELGLDLGARYFGSGHLRDKQMLIVDTERYRYQQFLSDIAGQDVFAHGDSAHEMMARVRDWLNVHVEAPLQGEASLRRTYARFGADLPRLCATFKLNHQRLDYNDFVFVTGKWLNVAV